MPGTGLGLKEGGSHLEELSLCTSEDRVQTVWKEGGAGSQQHDMFPSPLRSAQQ